MECRAGPHPAGTHDFITPLPSPRLLTRPPNPPDPVAGVVRDQQGAVAGDQDADRAAPDFGTRWVGHESGQEILVVAARVTVTERDPHDLVAGPERAVPRAVEGDEGVTA